MPPQSVSSPTSVLADSANGSRWTADRFGNERTDTAVSVSVVAASAGTARQRDMPNANAVMQTVRGVRRLTDSRFPLVLWTVLDLEFVFTYVNFEADWLGGILDVELRGDGCRVASLNLTVSVDVSSTSLLTVLECRHGE